MSGMSISVDASPGAVDLFHVGLVDACVGDRRVDALVRGLAAQASGRKGQSLVIGREPAHNAHTHTYCYSIYGEEGVADVFEFYEALSGSRPNCVTFWNSKNLSV